MTQKMRSIKTKFWKDSFIVSLTPLEKLVYLYLITNPSTNLAGIYEITEREIAFDTGIKDQQVQAILTVLQAAGRVIYFNGWVYIKNFKKNQKFNPSMKKCYNEIIKSIPENISKHIFDDDRVGTGWVQGVGNVHKKEVEVEVEVEVKRKKDNTVSLWNTFAIKHKGISQIKEITSSRDRKLNLRLKEAQFQLETILLEAESQPFLLGKNDRGWVFSFDWLIENDTNYIKILERKYANADKPNTVVRF